MAGLREREQRAGRAAGELEDGPAGLVGEGQPQLHITDVAA
jgi:hypothetical protein